MRRRGPWLPEPLGATVERELARLGRSPTGNGDLAAILGAWPRAVGTAIARNAWPARFTRDGTLVVHTSSSAWAFELGYLESRIRDQLGDLAPPKLRFAVGALPDAGPETEEGVQRSRPRPGPAERARGEEIAVAIEDPELRAAVARAAAAALSQAPRATGSTAQSDTLHRG